MRQRGGVIARAATLTDGVGLKAPAPPLLRSSERVVGLLPVDTEWAAGGFWS